MTSTSPPHVPASKASASKAPVVQAPVLTEEQKAMFRDAKDGTRLIHDDPWLLPHIGEIRRRYSHYTGIKHAIEEKEGGLDAFSRGFERFGLLENAEGVTYREWAPGAREMFLWGDFNNWDPNTRVRCDRNEFGVWTCRLPRHPDGTSPIPHNSRVKCHMILPSGEHIDRIPAWIRCTSQSGTNPLDGRHWAPPHPYVFRHQKVARPRSLRIYECHVGMSSEEGKVSSYREFADNVLPHIAMMGYTAVQIMAIMEHAYYASFGYQVTNFFACASRCGTPEDLQYLVDTAHGLGLFVLMDTVHSHASKNVLDGLNMFDGTDHLYFHGGGRGVHDLWDSRLFNYSSWEVLRFLLSNLRYYADFYQFDGFRFDGVMSMIYHHHGLNTNFGGGYPEYFGPSVDGDALAYLTLANDMLHTLYPNMITIAEEVSGMPGLCRPCSEGGQGFDFRLGMALPDKWIELLKKKRDEDWDIENVAFTMQNRRYLEAVVAYAESHDQALVGDKTIAFWLMDKEMYTGMSLTQPANPIIERGIALHKMIRLLTCALGGEAYLTFMGNEFGHPEWIDFPRAGNNSSFHYCRRQWHLAKDPLLRYQHLLHFERAMLFLEDQHHWLPAPNAWVTVKNSGDKVLAFERAGLLFVFNFHPSHSFTDYRIGVMKPGIYTMVLDSDSEAFGGQKRIDPAVEHHADNFAIHGHFHSIMLYLPARTAQVYVRRD